MYTAPVGILRHVPRCSHVRTEAGVSIIVRGPAMTSERLFNWLVATPAPALSLTVNVTIGFFPGEASSTRTNSSTSPLSEAES